MIICLVFLPLLSLQGLEGKLFGPVALTIIFALSGSLILSLTLIPVLASFMLKTGQHGEPLLMRLLIAATAGLLQRCTRLPAACLCDRRGRHWARGRSPTAPIGKTFMPTMDEGSVIMQITKLPSINLASQHRRRSPVQRTF